MHCLLQMSQDSWSWKGPLGIVSSGTLMWRQLRVHTAAEEDGRQRLRCCSVPRMQQVSVAGVGAGAGLARGSPTPFPAQPPSTPQLFIPAWARARAAPAQGRVLWGCTYSAAFVFTTAGWLFESFPPSLFLWHAALLGCCQPLPVLPHQCGSAVLPSPPLTSARRGVGDTEGVRRGGGQWLRGRASNHMLGRKGVVVCQHCVQSWEIAHDHSKVLQQLGVAEECQDFSVITFFLRCAATGKLPLRSLIHLLQGLGG